MQCVQCHKTIELTDLGVAPEKCPHCGAAVQAEPAPAPSARRGGGMVTALVAVLFLVLAGVSVVSTLYAMRTVQERDRAWEDIADGSATINEMVVGAAKNSKLKGPSAAEARREILGPALEHYDRIIQKYKDDEPMRPAVTVAQFRKAALQAKLGIAECVQTMSSGLTNMSLMLKADYPEESFPSFQDNVMRIAEPTDWINIPGTTAMSQGAGLYSNLQAGVSTYRQLSQKYPQSVMFRDNLSELCKSSAMLLTLIGRKELALQSWVESRDVLETLVRDEPGNVDFQERLVEALVGAAKLEDSTDKKDEAIADYKRAVEVRQQMAEANPEDESLKKALARAQSDLEKIEASAAAKPDAAQEEKTAEEAESS